MKTNQFKKLFIATAVSAAFISAGPSYADEYEEQLVAVKLTTLDQQLLVNAVYQSDEEGTFADAMLLAPVAELPVECDTASVFPSAETFVDNPEDMLIGSWMGEDFYIDDEDEADEEDDDFEDDDLDGENEDMDDDGADEQDDFEDDDSDEDDMDDIEGDDEDDDFDDDDESDQNLDLDDEDMDEANEEGYETYLTVSPSGYLVASEMAMEDGITTCEVSYIGELEGDVYRPVGGADSDDNSEDGFEDDFDSDDADEVDDGFDDEDDFEDDDDSDFDDGEGDEDDGDSDDDEDEDDEDDE